MYELLLYFAIKYQSSAKTVFILKLPSLYVHCLFKLHLILCRLDFSHVARTFKIFSIACAEPCKKLLPNSVLNCNNKLMNNNAS